MNVSNDINNTSINKGAVMHDSYQKNTGHNVDVHTDIFLLDGSDDEVGTNTTKKKTSSNLMTKVIVAGGSILLVAILANNVVKTTTTTTDANRASVRTNPLAALLELDLDYTAKQYPECYAKLQTDNEWLGKSYCTNPGPLVQSCYKVKGSDQHCWSNSVHTSSFKFLYITAFCVPDGTDWECVPNGDLASCGPRCLDFG